jgi:hypothetical protein
VNYLGRQTPVGCCLLKMARGKRNGFLILDVSYYVNIFIMLSTVARIGCIHSYDFIKIIKIL